MPAPRPSSPPCRLCRGSGFYPLDSDDDCRGCDVADYETPMTDDEIADAALKARDYTAWSRL